MHINLSDVLQREKEPKRNGEAEKVFPFYFLPILF